jgi:hypothetical protein
MTRRSHRYALLAAAALTALLAGCATRPHEREHDHAGMDPQSMCEMHRKMMGSMTPAQQQAMMDEHVKSMSPEMRSRMQEMHARCQ